MPDVDYREVSAAILKYLAENPEGKDTIRGIAHFWIAKREIEKHVALVEKALADLVRGGYVVEKKRGATAEGGGESIYSLNPSSMPAIQCIIDSVHEDG